MAPAKKSMHTRHSPVSQRQLFLDPIPRAGIWPDEDPEALESLREAFRLDLNPGTPYENSLVEQIVALEWEIHRARRLRDSLLFSAVKVAADRALANSSVEWEEENAPALITQDLFGEDQVARKTAIEELSDIGVTLTGLTTQSYQSQADDIQFFDYKIGELERRKRRQREDFDNLKKTRVDRRAAISDAETVE